MKAEEVWRLSLLDDREVLWLSTLYCSLKRNNLDWIIFCIQTLKVVHSFQNCLYYDSHNYRAVEVGRDPTPHLASPFLLKQNLTELVAQGYIHVDFEYLQAGTLPLGNVIECLVTLTVWKCLLFLACMQMF